MKPKIILCLFILQMIILPQKNFIQQITSGDFDARNPFIYENSFGEYRELFFELHKNGYSNIYSIKYNSDTKKFEDTVALTSGNYLNINPVFKPNLGLLYQTNKNGNWDIVLLPDSNGVWKSPRFLTNSLSDEISPKFFESMNLYPPDSNRILFKRSDDIVCLSYEGDKILENILFQDNPDITYSDFVGYVTDIWNSSSGYYVFAIEDSLGYKKIVRKFKPYNSNTWQDKIILKDSCDCKDLTLQTINYYQWGIFYSDTLLAERRFFVIQNPVNPNVSSELVQTNPAGNLSHLDIYTFLIVTKRNENPPIEFGLYYPHTYVVEQNGVSKVRIDVSDLGFWDRDSLVRVKITNPKLAIGPVGSISNIATCYTVWEDSIDNHIQLFGSPKIIIFGSVENESFAKDFVLYQNYPNPFNPNTTIEYKILKGSEIRFNVINILGEKVFEKNFGYQSAGNYKIDFSATGGSANGGNAYNLPSGVYIYSIITDENKLSRKMLLLK